MKNMKIIEGPNSFTAITCDMLPYDKLHARAAVAHYFNKKFIEVFDEVHLEDVASLIVALEGFLVGYKSVIEQHPEEKQAYIELSNKMTTITVYDKHEEDTNETDKFNP